MTLHPTPRTSTGRVNSGRGAGELVASFTPPGIRGLPTRPTPGRTAAAIEKVNRRRAPRRGRPAAGHGWAPVEAPVSVYQATTAEIGGLFPLLASDTLPAVGARMGYDPLSGGAFHCHPIEWVVNYKLASNPNMVCFGEPGVGKSSTIVAFLLRMMLYGTKVLISGDVKGEYTPLVRALGVTPIVLGRGSPARLNALDLGPLSARWAGWSVARQRTELAGVLGRWTTLLMALAQAQGAPVDQTDEAALTAVLRRLVGAEDGYTALRPITIPDVLALLCDPDPQLVAGERFADRQQFFDTLRPLTNALKNLVAGPLAGLFDAPTNFDLDWDAPIQSMDLSRLKEHGDRAVGVALTCLGSWSSLITALQDDGDIRIVVRDEVWRQMRLGLRAVQAVDSDLRLSRAEQRIQILVMHKPSDPLSVGAAGSQEVAIAKDLLALCSTRILCGQSTRVADELAEDFGLTEKEQQVITKWAMQRKGRALWKIENNPGRKIQTVLSHTEKRIFNTNAQLVRKDREFRDSEGSPAANPRVRGS